MRRHELIFRLFRVPVEASVVFGAFYAGRQIRLVTDLIPGVQLPIQRITESQLLFFAASGAALYVIVSFLQGAYRISYDDEWGIEGFLKTVSVSFSWFLYFLALAYLGAGYLTHAEIPRLIIFFALALSVVGVSLVRFGFSTLRSALLRGGCFPARKVLVLSGGDPTDVLSEILSNPGYRLVGFANSVPSHSSYFGNKDAVIDACRNREFEEIVSLDSDFSKTELEEIFDVARTYGIAYRYADRFLLSESRRTRVSFLAGVPLVEVVSIGLGPWGRVMKRAFDIFASAFLILALSPLLVTVALAVWLSDFHPPVYRSVRVGRLGRTFPMFKFRSMRPDADALKAKLMKKNERVDGPLFKIENDPRITKIGRFLRRFDIDELPQLFNVLLGDMSLVGPRPHLPDEVKKYEESQKRVLTLKPGITGMAQVNGRHRNSFDDEVRFDVFYIENWSIALDLKILLKTIAVVVSK